MRSSIALLLALLANLVLALTAHGQATAAASSQSQTSVLKWETQRLRHQAENNEVKHTFIFRARNIGAESVAIQAVTASCGCTAAKLPELPWKIAPGEQVPLEVTMDFAGKRGTVIKSLEVESSAGMQQLLLEVNIPQSAEELLRRMENQGQARADRQAIFRNDCARCHVQPGIEKNGWPLFLAACAICHQAEHRASMVPDLAITSQSRDEAYWRHWITQGAENTLMPAFAQDHGGPLSEEQVNSLVKFLVRHYSGKVVTPAPQLESKQRH